MRRASYGVATTVGVVRPMRRDDAGRLAKSFADIGWNKPASLFEGYLSDQEEGLRWVRVAEQDGHPVGYVTLLWRAPDPVLRARGIPEIVDLNVLPSFRRHGVGSALLDAAEAEASTRGSLVGLRVGLHSGYGAAQRIYVRRGYVPDGSGVVIDGTIVAEGASIRLDDEPSLRLILDFEARAPFPDRAGGTGPGHSRDTKSEDRR